MKKAIKIIERSSTILERIWENSNSRNSVRALEVKDYLRELKSLIDWTAFDKEQPPENKEYLVKGKKKIKGTNKYSYFYTVMEYSTEHKRFWFGEVEEYKLFWKELEV